MFGADLFIFLGALGPLGGPGPSKIEFYKNFGGGPGPHPRGQRQAAAVAPFIQKIAFFEKKSARTLETSPFRTGCLHNHEGPVIGFYINSL